MKFPRSIDTITVLTRRGAVVMPWKSRQLLLERLRRRLDDAATGVVQEFEDAGASRPVTLTPERQALLAGEIETWLVEVGARELPEGIVALRNALIDEQHLGGA